MHACVLSPFRRVWLFATLWTVACQTSLSVVFFKQEYRSGLPCPPPGDLPNSGINPTHIFCVFGIAGRFFTVWATGEAPGSLVRDLTITSFTASLFLGTTLFPVGVQQGRPPSSLPVQPPTSSPVPCRSSIDAIPFPSSLLPVSMPPTDNAISATWVGLESIIVSEEGEREEQYHMTPFTFRICSCLGTHVRIKDFKI